MGTNLDSGYCAITASSSGTDSGKSAKFPSHSGRLPAQYWQRNSIQEGIKRDLQLLLNDQSQVESLSVPLHFDRSTLSPLLQARGDIPEEEAARIVDQVYARLFC